MITIDPDTLHVNADVLRDVVRRFDNQLCVNAEVVRAATIRIGDHAALIAAADVDGAP
jgi:hypothetical protein